MKLPQPISDYYCDWLAQKRALGYILLEADGRVRSWGGELQRLGIGPLEEGRPISDQLELMEGLLPLEEAALQLPLLRPDANHALDIHLFKIDAGYGLLLMDASQDAQRLGLFQQQVNESALLRKQHSTHDQTGGIPPSSGLIENLFLACNTAALTLNPDGCFTPIGRVPGWLNEFFPEAADRHSRLAPGNYFAFLENFLLDAHDFWSKESVGFIKSGLWIEPDPAGQEHLFEATALYTGSEKILLIGKEQHSLIEKQQLIRKAREIALDRSVLQADRDQLQVRVKARTQELEQTKGRLARELVHSQQLETERTEMIFQLQQAQKMEAIGTLAGGIAHDFNNILSAVMGFTELSLIQVPPGSQLETNLRHVLSAGLRAKKLISQILTFSRQSHPEIQPVQLAGIIKEAIELIRASLPATIEIEQDLNSKAYVLGDPSQLHQVVMNLCTNASQAMQPNGGVLRLSLRECVIGPGGSPDGSEAGPGNCLAMEVSDTGSGMSPETLKRIFDPFFTTKEKGLGTGMGLSVVHGIIKSCQGEISVASKLGQGTTFRILLPVTSQRQVPKAQSQTQLPAGNECILYVDDEPMQADLAQKFLQPLGYRVVALIDSTLALQAFMENPDQFDLVLTDMYMPKMTGKMLSEEIKRIRPRMPVIICSGYSEGALDPVTNGRRFDDYLIKPFSMKELVSTIRKALDKRS
jgi:signal transduction histidine kinase/ActR/RegA family two-component response regulator